MSAPSARPCTPADDGWAILAQPPGERDLALAAYWDVSGERSERRRNAPRRNAIVRRAGGRASVALAALALGGTLAADGAGVAQATATTTGGGLRPGDSGARVKALQRALGVTADGAFGPVTKRAVIAFQRAHGLEAKGVVGPLTARALGLSAGRVRTAPAGDGVGGGNVVSLSPAATRAMQKALGVTADGQIGPQTRAALKAYESAHGLPADGQPDADSLKALGVDPNMAGSGTSSASAPQGQGASAAVAAAQAKVGSRYAAGATGPSSFDCSGLVQYAFRQAGISLPRSSFAQYGVGTSVPKSGIQAGDIVFFNTNGPGASHDGIATGPTTAISATSHGVMEHSLTDSYWGSHFVGARRVS